MIIPLKLAVRRVDDDYELPIELLIDRMRSLERRGPARYRMDLVFYDTETRLTCVYTFNALQVADFEGGIPAIGRQTRIDDQPIRPVDREYLIELRDEIDRILGD